MVTTTRPPCPCALPSSCARRVILAAPAAAGPEQHIAGIIVALHHPHRSGGARRHADQMQRAHRVARAEGHDPAVQGIGIVLLKFRDSRTRRPLRSPRARSMDGFYLASTNLTITATADTNYKFSVGSDANARGGTSYS